MAGAAQEFMGTADSRTYDVILSDHRVSDWNGLNAFRWFRSSGYYTPLIVVTGTLGDELAIECIKAGVNDYVLKENLGPVAVRRALEEEKSAREA